MQPRVGRVQTTGPKDLITASSDLGHALLLEPEVKISHEARLNEDEVVAILGLDRPKHLAYLTLRLEDGRIVPGIDFAGIVEAEDSLLKLWRHSTWRKLA